MPITMQSNVRSFVDTSKMSSVSISRFSASIGLLPDINDTATTPVESMTIRKITRICIIIYSPYFYTNKIGIKSLNLFLTRRKRCTRPIKRGDKSKGWEIRCANYLILTNNSYIHWLLHDVITLCDDKMLWSSPDMDT